MSALLSSTTDLLRPGGTRNSGQAAGGAFNPAADFAAKLETLLAGGDAAGTSDDAEAKAGDKDKELPPIGGSDYGMYANVVVNGKVVASLSNSGGAMIAEGYGIQIPMDGDGPQLARARAEAIAQQLGGTVQVLSTAMSEAAWNRTGRSPNKADWSLGGDEPPGYHPTIPPLPDPLLLAQERRDDVSVVGTLDL